MVHVAMHFLEQEEMDDLLLFIYLSHNVILFEFLRCWRSKARLSFCFVTCCPPVVRVGVGRVFVFTGFSLSPSLSSSYQISRDKIQTTTTTSLIFSTLGFTLYHHHTSALSHKNRQNLLFQSQETNIPNHPFTFTRPIF